MRAQMCSDARWVDGPGRVEEMGEAQRKPEQDLQECALDQTQRKNTKGLGEADGELERGHKHAEREENERGGG